MQNPGYIEARIINVAWELKSEHEQAREKREVRTSQVWITKSVQRSKKVWNWKVIECESESRSGVSNSLRRHGLYSPWNSPGQNTGVGRLSLLQGIFPIQGSNPGLLHCRWILHPLSYNGTWREDNSVRLEDSAWWAGSGKDSYEKGDGDKEPSSGKCGPIKGF